MSLDFIIQILKSTPIFVFVIAIMVFVHELGHYVSARLVGAKVEEFAIGFGKSIFSRKWGETIYKINILPLGGYCKILGESDNIDDERSLSSKNPLQRIFVLVSGVLMNILLAIIIFYFILFASSWKTMFSATSDLPNVGFIGVDAENVESLVLTGVSSTGSAASVGMVAPRIVVSINGVKDVDLDTFREEIAKKNGSSVSIVLLDPNDNSEEEFNVPVKDSTDEGTPVIGVGLQEISFWNLDYSNHKLTAGVMHAYNALYYNVIALGSMISKSVSTKDVTPLANETGGLIRLAEETNALVRSENWVTLLNLLALVNISLAIMNMLPILPLDGGFILVILIETIIRRPLPEKLKQYVTMFGVAVLLVLFVAITYKDIAGLDSVKYFLGLFFK